VGHFDVNSPTLSTPSVFLVFLVYIIGISAIFQPNLIRGVVAAMDSDPNQTLLPAVSERPQASAPVTESATEMGVAATEQAEEAGPAAPTRTKNDKTKTDKYQRSRVSLADAEKYKIRLMQAMQEKELYLDSELTLPDLAKYTGLTPHQVSQVINGQMSQNFFSFVNNYRIQLAKKLMSEPDTRNMPIVELAVEVGFKSKSSFYDAFKKATQITPTQFKKTVEA
jgi:AraC-like DNA-binding protein